MSTAHSRLSQRRGPNRGLRGCLVLLGCWSLAASAAAEDSAARAAPAGVHSDFDSFLQHQVDDSGRIDYAKLQAAAADSGDLVDLPDLADLVDLVDLADLADLAALNRYTAWLERVSPDSHAEVFTTRAARLAYWINAYNAWVIRKVLDHYPISSVRDVHSDWLFFLPRLSSFFVFEKITLGGARTNLRALENKIIRKRFRDPRVHFALNCASQSCPRLPTRAFTAAGLEQELARETLRFLNDPAHLRLNRDGSRIELSSIFKWYERDFTEWMKRERTEEPATLQGYLASQLPEPAANKFRDCRNCRVEFMDYDWSLNDRRPRD